jgi:nitroreductase/NAD-dependent dihydropyrimidine dehydrogenase PreA subunit
MITIDKDLCQRDRLCALECPVSVISLEGGDGFPRTVDGAESLCLRCGHCVAVCPHGALSHEASPVESSPEIQKGLDLNRDQLAQFLRSRRSTRVFLDKEVARGTVEELINLARYAPTGSNLQLVEWLVLSDRDKLHELSALTVDWMREALARNAKTAPPYLAKLIKGWEDGFDTVLRNAPLVLVGMVNKDARNGLVDTTIALTFLDLAAPRFGLGTCWAGLLQGAMMNWPPVKKTMGISEDYPFHYPMMVGYNKFRYHRMVQRRPAKITWR